MKPKFLMAEVKAVDTEDDPNGGFEVILSAPTVDRDGEVVDGKAFEPLPPWINFDLDHAMTVEKTVGSGVPYYDGDVLKVKGTYASTELGQLVRTLVKEGHIRQTSVAYMPPKREVKDGVPHIVKSELLNGAFVGVPSNRDAVVLAAKSYAEARRSAGAPGLKAIEGSYEERREQVRDAIRTANAEAWWTYVIATFDDSVVYEVERPDGTARYRAGYSIGAEGVTLGAAEEVQITEVVEPVKDAPGAVVKSADPATPTDATGAEEAELLMRAEAALALRSQFAAL